MKNFTIIFESDDFISTLHRDAKDLSACLDKIFKRYKLNSTKIKVITIKV